MLLFDAQGHLTPYGLIQTDWATFIHTFSWNKRRQTIIDSLHLFVQRLNRLQINVFDLWIDGSFVTHKDQPNDLDIVLFLPTPIYQLHEQALRALRDEFSSWTLFCPQNRGRRTRSFSVSC